MEHKKEKKKGRKKGWPKGKKRTPKNTVVQEKLRREFDRKFRKKVDEIYEWISKHKKQGASFTFNLSLVGDNGLDYGFGAVFVNGMKSLRTLAVAKVCDESSDFLSLAVLALSRLEDKIKQSREKNIFPMLIKE